MNAPEHLHYLVSELGDSLVRALTADPHCRDLASQIQSRGYGLVLILEATPASAMPLIALEGKVGSEPELPFSEDDRRLMKSFKIRMD
jgi:hypothetical protein